MGKGKNRRRSVKAGPSKSSSAVVVGVGIVLHAYVVVGNAVRASCMLCVAMCRSYLRCLTFLCVEVDVTLGTRMAAACP